MNDLRRALPPVDQILLSPELHEHLPLLGRAFIAARVREQLAVLRNDPPKVAPSAGEIARRVAADLPAAPTSLSRVINASGVIIHTNLGRAPLSLAATRAIERAAGATDVELDLASGKRAPRGRATIQALRDAVGGAGAHVVNNGAAAIALACHALVAPGGNIVLSRGEMVEIGDGFRIPELIAATGVELREVGTTNRTHLRDYIAAIDERTGFILKVHPSNYRIEGFSRGVAVRELAGSTKVPVVADIGSGLINPHPRLPTEPDATSTLRHGAALVIASGDKLLGGPQAGLLLGDEALIEKLRRHPLARAYRVDKFTLAALEATLLGPTPPVARALAADPADLHRRAQAIADHLGQIAAVRETAGAVGGGGAPGQTLPSTAVVLPISYAHPLRMSSPAVVGRIHGGELLLDLLAVEPAQDAELIAAVENIRDQQ